MHGDLRPALRRGIRSSGLDTADDAALHVRCWPLDDLVINSDVRFAPEVAIRKPDGITMSAIVHTTDSSQTLRHVRDVPKGDMRAICSSRCKPL